MRFLSADKWWWIVPVYVLGGLLLGVADPLLGRLVQQFGVRPGLATAASVNLVLPLFVIALGVVCPRPGTAWLGALVMTVAFTLGLAVVYTPVHGWQDFDLLGTIRPVLVLACLGYIILGTLAAFAARAAWR